MIDGNDGDDEFGWYALFLAGYNMIGKGIMGRA